MVHSVEQNRPKPDETSVRLEVSLRLKAARYLAGGLRPTKKGFEAGAMTVDDLAANPVIVKNGITKNRLDAYEQMKTEPRPMELLVIAEALGVDSQFLLEPLAGKQEQPVSVDETLEVLQDTLKALQDQLPRLGRDIGRRDLEWHPTRGRQDSVEEAAA